MRTISAGAPAVHRRAPLRRRAAGAAPAVLQRAPAVHGGLHCGTRRHLAVSVRSCSRRSTAGSIAARSSCQRRSRSRRVLPPFIGGLHCGAPAAGAARQVECECSRRSSAGSIAARRPPIVASRAAGVLPPFNGGLHCGPRQHAARRREQPRCSRRSRRAPLRHLHDRPVPAHVISGCSRRSAAGSIAAADCSRRRRRLAGAPAVQRRAPLRRRAAESLLTRDRARCSRRSTAGSIAASSSESRVPWRDPDVLPPFSGGLHCGEQIRVARGTSSARCSRRSAAGSIAAELVLTRRAAAEGAPAVQRRAPLRQLVDVYRSRAAGWPAWCAGTWPITPCPATPRRWRPSATS